MTSATMSRTKLQYNNLKNTMVETKGKVNQDKLSLIAAAMSYYMLFAFVPFIGSIVLLYALFSDPAQVSTQIASMSEQLPPEVQVLIKDQIAKFLSQISQLRVGLLVTLGLTLWAASNGTSALMQALNIIYEREEKRNIFKFYLVSFFLTISATLLCVLSVAVIIVLPSFLNFISLPVFLERLIPLVSWAILLLSFTGFLSLSYGFGACRTWRYWKKVMIGAGTASIVWALASLLFTWYVASFGNFNKTYGSLGAIIILMFWFYISSFVILLGAEISASLEKRVRYKGVGSPARRPN